MTSNFEVTVCNFKVTDIQYSAGASFEYAVTSKLAATDPPDMAGAQSRLALGT